MFFTAYSSYFSITYVTKLYFLFIIKIHDIFSLRVLSLFSTTHLSNVFALFLIFKIQPLSSRVYFFSLHIATLISLPPLSSMSSSFLPILLPSFASLLLLVQQPASTADRPSLQTAWHKKHGGHTVTKRPIYRPPLSSEYTCESISRRPPSRLSSYMQFVPGARN